MTHDATTYNFTTSFDPAERTERHPSFDRTKLKLITNFIAAKKTISGLSFSQ